MYRILFEHHPKENQEQKFIEQWQRGSDIIQTYPGALGTKLFRDPNRTDVLFAMAEWESKDARNAAMQQIKNEHPNADWVLHEHEKYLDSHEPIGEFELIAESNPSSK